MYQVKAFDEEHEDDLSDAINAFLAKMEHIQLYDIKFSTAICDCDDNDQIFCFSALIIYQT